MANPSAPTPSEGFCCWWAGSRLEHRRSGCYHAPMLLFLLACSGETDSSESSDLTDSPAALCEESPTGALSFPAADGPQADSPEERWSWSGRVVDAAGEGYRLSLEFFSADGHTGAVATLLPEAEALRSVLTEGEGSTASTGGFLLEAGGISASGGGGRDVLSVQASTWSWELVVAERKGVIVHDETAKWTGYSRPRMSAHGRIVGASGVPVEVEGELWFEHLWGRSNVCSFPWKMDGIFAFSTTVA
jgi:hypothetical protein